LQLFLGRLLRVGVTLAAAVSASALGLHIATGSAALPDYSVFRGEPVHERTIRGVLAGVLAREPAALMQLGLMILVATPLARVAFSVIGFALERDRLYVGLTLVVLALLLLGLFGVG
jgi:uncharacterized membrane protein